MVSNCSQDINNNQKTESGGDDGFVFTALFGALGMRESFGGESPLQAWQ